MTTLSKYVRVSVKILLLLISLFLFVFSLLSGSAEYGGGIHGIIRNSPNALPWAGLLVANYLVFKWEKFGGILLIILGIASIFFFSFWRNYFVLFVISLPLIVLGTILLLTKVSSKENVITES